MKLTKDLNFFEVDNNLYIAYAPLKKVLASINRDGQLFINFIKKYPDFEVDEERNPNFSKFIEFLYKSGLIDGKDCSLPPEPQPNFEPTEVILLPTYNCNLRCVYCYANSGDSAKATMSRELGRAAIDHVLKNSQNKGTKKVVLAFHGGGEPTVAWPLVIEVIGYAKAKSSENGIDLRIQITTNGVLSDKKREWIINNDIGIQVSFDGPRDIQNIQRPILGGIGSFDQVLKTIRFFEKKHHPYGIQTVITKASVMRMVEIVDFFHEVSGIKEIHFEPLFMCGRCIYSGWEEPAANDFIPEFLKAWKHAASLSINLHTSLSSLDSIHSSFCGAAGRNFIVSPEGNVTACLEVPNFRDSRSEIFIYGSYNNEKKFVINQDKLTFLASRNIYNMPGCRNCFAAWHCGGDCLAKSLSIGKLFDPSQTERCSMAKTLTLEQLKTILFQPEIGSKIGIKVFEFQF